MKKTILFTALALALSSCTPDYLDCPDGGVYKQHEWSMTPDYNEDGWYEQTCQNCGLERKSNTSVKYLKHYGMVYLYKNPRTKIYSDYMLYYEDEAGPHLESVSRSDLKGPVK